MGDGERIAAGSESRKIFFAFFAEFFSPFDGVITQGFKASRGGDQLSDPVLRVLLNPLRLSHERKIAADRETARKKIIITEKKRGGVFSNDCRFRLTAKERGGGEHYQNPISQTVF